MSDERQEAKQDFDRGDRQTLGSSTYQEEYNRLERERRAAQEAWQLPPSPQRPSPPLTPAGALATVALLVAGYFALSIASGNSSAAAVQMVRLGSWLIFLAAVFLVPLITISPLTRSFTGLQGEEAGRARRRAFVVLGAGLGLGRLLNGGLDLNMTIAVAAVVSLILAYILSRTMPARPAIALAIGNSAGVVVIDMIGMSVLVGLLVQPVLG